MENKLFEKLKNVQGKVGKLRKDKANPFFKSNYADINQVLEQLMPLIQEEKLIILQPLSNIDGKPALETIVADDDGKISYVTPLPENPDPQKMGSAITYFRRYALVSLFCLQAEDDDGNVASNKKTKNKELDEIDL